MSQADIHLHAPEVLLQQDEFQGFAGPGDDTISDQLHPEEARALFGHSVDGSSFATPFTQLDEYGSLMRANLGLSGVYLYGALTSQRLAFNTRMPALRPHSVSGHRPRLRFALTGRQTSSRFLVSLTENGVDPDIIREHLETVAWDVPYLVASYHGLLGMALVSAVYDASRQRHIYEPASADLPFPPAGQSPRNLGDLQDVRLAASSRWLGSLCAPVRFNSEAPATPEHFLPNTDQMVRWHAIKDRYRAREYQSSLPLGVATTSLEAGTSLGVTPINENHFVASRRHPVVVTMPSGTVIMMCLNTLDGFGEDRHDRGKSPLLDWAIAKLHGTGGINTVYRHGLQRTVFSLLAEEVYKAELEQRRPSVPWVGDGVKAARLPVVLDHEVVHPEVSASDIFRHILDYPL